MNEFLKESNELINGQRAKDYGDAADSFKMVADLWSTVLGVPISETQFGLCMILLKVARMANTGYHKDSIVDIIGYAALAGTIEEDKLREMWQRQERGKRKLASYLGVETDAPLAPPEYTAVKKKEEVAPTTSEPEEWVPPTTTNSTATAMHNSLKENIEQEFPDSTDKEKELILFLRKAEAEQTGFNLDVTGLHIQHSAAIDIYIDGDELSFVNLGNGFECKADNRIQDDVEDATYLSGLLNKFYEENKLC